MYVHIWLCKKHKICPTVTIMELLDHFYALQIYDLQAKRTMPYSMRYGISSGKLFSFLVICLIGNERSEYLLHYWLASSLRIIIMLNKRCTDNSLIFLHTFNAQRTTYQKSTQQKGSKQFKKTFRAVGHCPHHSKIKKAIDISSGWLLWMTIHMVMISSFDAIISTHSEKKPSASSRIKIQINKLYSNASVHDCFTVSFSYGINSQ